MTNELSHTANHKDFSLYIPNDVITKENKNPFLENLVLTQLGYFHNKRGHYTRRLGINEYIFIYCIDGKGFLEIANTKYPIGKGDIFFCDINSPHAYGADGTTPWSIHWGHFIGQGVPELFSTICIPEAPPLLHIGDQPKILELLAEARKIISNGYTLANLLYSSTCLLQIFCHLTKLKMNLKPEHSTEFNIENIIAFMLSNTHTSLPLDEFAYQANMSKYHFSRIFKKNTGYAPMEYFTRLKIQKACNLLHASSLSIKEISDLLSFNNQFYFSEVFKRITGYSPSKYRLIQMSPYN